MTHKLLSAALAGCLALSMAASARCADLVGKVSDVNAKPVKSVRISAEDASAKVAGTVLTDAKGAYRIGGLAVGNYTFVLDPKGTPFQGGSAVAYLGDKGLTVDWRVSPSVAPSAMAAQGSDDSLLAMDPFGMSLGQFVQTIVTGAGVVGGGTLGGYGAAGGFGGGHGHPAPQPVSPSM